MRIDERNSFAMKRKAARQIFGGEGIARIEYPTHVNEGGVAVLLVELVGDGHRSAALLCGEGDPTTGKAYATPERLSSLACHPLNHLDSARRASGRREVTVRR